VAKDDPFPVYSFRTLSPRDLAGFERLVMLQLQADRWQAIAGKNGDRPSALGGFVLIKSEWKLQVARQLCSEMKEVPGRQEQVNRW
jgi:hypothetical protein